MPLKDPIALAAYRKQYYKDNREKKKAWQKQYNKDNREERKAKAKQYYKKNRDEIKIKSKQYYKDHYGEKLTRDRQYHKDNREKRLVYSRQYYKDNREKMLVYLTQYRKDHKEERKQYNKDHPEVELRAQKKLFKKLGLTRYQIRAWTKVIRKGKDCSYCGSNKKLHSHHIFPKSKYKDLALNENNGVVLCDSCHKEHHSLNGVN